jgi:hypothetical protein
MGKMAQDYPRVESLGINVKFDRGVPFIPWQHLDERLKESGVDKRRFDKLFGVQTCLERGPYPWDVEAVLERMFSGKLVGTQLFWD